LSKRMWHTLAEKNKHKSKRLNQGRGAVGKNHVHGMRDRDGQLVMQVVANEDAPTLQGMIKENVLPGSTVCTDEASAYRGLDANFEHKTVNHSAGQYVDGDNHTNSIEAVWAVMKRGNYGVYHHMSKEHLFRYVNEFAFRLNEGNCKHDTIDRLAALIRGVPGKRLTYKMLVNGE